ncbi:phosphonate ABC transporter, permease protein PhnE [Kribbella sp. CA-293567]|uniref:phosphonate ABC transporter, permease protein PhnE n=1 Tax=Kribbella sp. CA-293567 TaxID=3002436 RepID=UPI0022DDB255|nr:phosphonate ABC transporter, permease protein PhnE [Kribbella sp. CA-293567]WBQ04423.1 phosphonate ABC transporter, permease protein PhnE [Kribbella sp. CA-293567]
MTSTPPDLALAPKVRAIPDGRTAIRPPIDRRRVLLAAVAIAAAVVTGWSTVRLEFTPSALIEGADDVQNLIERMLPVRLDDPARIFELAGETLLIALLGTVLSVLLSVPLAFLAASNTTPHRAVYAVARGAITFCRAVPDLVFAVLLVRAMGIGVLPGVLALALHSVGMVAKLFADAIERVDPGPREAVRSTGAGRLRELVGGVLPQVVPSWISTFVYRVDINLRTSVVLGFVGAGGIGFALQDALRGLVYDKALGIVLVILAIIAAMELLSIWVRRLLLQPGTGKLTPAGKSSPPWTRDRVARLGLNGVVLAAVILSFPVLRIDPVALLTSPAALVDVAGRLFPPDFTLVGDRLAAAVIETVAIGVLSTAIGILLSVPLGLLAARNIAPHPAVYWSARAVVLAIRAIPELILAVVFVAAIGLGPTAGVCALAIGSVGFLGKLLADAAEEIADGPREAIRAAGGGWWQELFSAVLPQVLPAMVGSGLYLLDVNIRMSTILGIVGAGGVGFLLFEAVRTLNFPFAGAIVLIIFVVVYVIERLSGWIRSQVQ